MKEKKTIVKLIGNALYMLLIFLFLADPTNTILGLKNVVFALLFVYNIIFFRPDYRKVLFFILPVASVTLSLLFALMQEHVIDSTELKAVYTSYIPLLLLMWSDNYDVIKLSLLPATITAIIVLILFWLIFFIPSFEAPVYIYMGEHDDTIMLSNRSFIGIRIFCMYLKSTVAFLMVYGFVLYNVFCEKKLRLPYILICLIMLHLFLISGTRSSMLLPILLACIIFFIYRRNGRYMRYITYPAVLVFCVLFFVLLTVLLMETDEPSNFIKYGHLTSYKNLFNEHPEYLLFGQGPATEFYTIGFRCMALKTEWTYLELLRNYGLFCLPIMYVLLRPIFTLIKLALRHDSALAILVTYIIYLVIAGTNPLLFSSTGMLIILSVYSYIEKLKKSEVESLKYC